MTRPGNATDEKLTIRRRYTVAGPSTARPLPDWLARRRKRSSKYDAENLNNFELLQEFEFEEGKSPRCSYLATSNTEY